MLSLYSRNLIIPALIASFAASPASADNSSLAPASGELRVRGVIQNVQPGGGSFLLAVQSVTGSDGETHAFSNPRAKQIALTTECTIQRGDSSGIPADIIPGLSVIVIGRNDGAGSTLPARLVRLGSKSDINLSYVPSSLTPASYAAPDNGGNGLLPALPGVGGADLSQSYPSPAQTAGPKIDYDGVTHDKVVVPLIFPIAGRVSWSDTFLADRDGGKRRHHGQDLMASKMTPLVACFDGTVSLARGDSPIIYLKADNGWSASYIHVNNDTPGTDDGKGGDRYAFAPGLVSGMRVRAGQLIGYVGDSGNAENTGPHCHFELHKNGAVYNAAPSLRNAQRLTAARTALPGAIQTAQYAQSSLPPVAPQGATNTGVPSPLSGMETEIIIAINKQREKAGVAPLTIRPELMRSARQHSADMAERNKLEHMGANGSTPGQRAQANGYTAYTLLGENVAMNGGFEKPVGQAIEGWMKSDGHRTNILNPAFTETGVGVAKVGNLYYFTQVFGHPVTPAGIPAPTEISSTEETAVATHALPPNSPKRPASTQESDLSDIQDLTPELGMEAAASQDRATRLLDLINYTRREHKLPEVKLSTKLSTAAQAGSLALAHDTKVHRAGNSLSVPLDRRLREARYPATATVRENLATGTDDPDRLISLWQLRGGPARLNLLAPDITEIGIGYSTEASTDGPIHTWNILFSNQPQ